MIVLRSDKLKNTILDLGSRLNEILQVLNEMYAINLDNETVNKLIRELRSKSSSARYTKGGTNVTSKVGDIEVIYVLTASGYKDIIRDAINYYTNVLMAIKQVTEFSEKLGIGDNYTVIIDGSSIDVIIGYSLPDVSDLPLLTLSNIKEMAEIPSVLVGITGLTADELAKVMVTIDKLISSMSTGSNSFETVVKISDINYPEPFKKIEELIGGTHDHRDQEI